MREKMKTSSKERLLIKEELTTSDVQQIKKMIERQLVKLFYQLYVKKTFWSEK